MKSLHHIQKILLVFESEQIPDLILVEPSYIHRNQIITETESKKEGLKFKSRPQIRIEQIKYLQGFLTKHPIQSKRNYALINNAELMNESSNNALLKTLEDAQRSTVIMINNRYEKTINTIISRSQIISFNRLSLDNIKNIFDNQKENNIDRNLLLLSNGSPGEIMKNIEILENIPGSIISYFNDDNNKDYFKSLEISNLISKELDVSEQLWLIRFIQTSIWSKKLNIELINILEIMAQQIKKNVNPRNVWETGLLKMKNQITL